eukprot:CAMPEP_0172451980 /NCGR_PEP_ID=MMETSP1065-20121228/9771_1 /TAXON_ID=265537 /ORGANISM="Amphiprora paludosa, Strain CCMP125" /LENGTH=493 /DNA_ID=CAMNT_0013203951 /DNA_START=234 /DNA_END=1715 /DNA_ORIENTATION=+
MADQKAMKKRLKVLMSLPENQVCSDCTERQPRWASLIVPPPGAPPDSLAIGAFCCLECSGSHRRLGVHISFVRSINLDSWKEKEVLAMENGGNSKVNMIFEARLNSPKPSNQADLNTRERFIRDKYERRKFYDSSAFAKIAAMPAQRPPEPQQQVPSFDADFSQTGNADFSQTGNVGTPSAAAQRRLEKRRTGGDSASVGGTAQRRSSATGKSRSKSSLTPPVGDLLDFSSEVVPERRVGRKKSKEGFGDAASVVSAPEKRSVPRRKSKEDMSVGGDPRRGVARKKSKDKDLLAFVVDNSGSAPAPAAPKNDFADFAAPAPPAPPAAKPKASSQDIMSLYNSSPVPQTNTFNAASMNQGMMNNSMAGMTNMMQQMNMQQQQPTMMAQPQQRPVAQLSAQQMQQQAMMYQQHMMRLQQMQAGMMQQQQQPMQGGMGGSFGGNMMMPQQQQMGMMQQQQPMAASTNGAGMSMASSVSASTQPAENKDPFASLGSR